MVRPMPRLLKLLTSPRAELPISPIGDRRPSAGGPQTTSHQKQRLARKFLSVPSNPDREAVVKSVAVDDVIWTFPGSSAICGEARGTADIEKRAKAIAAHDDQSGKMVRTVYGHRGVAIILHKTSTANGRVLDEHLAAVFSFRSAKISRLYYSYWMCRWLKVFRRATVH